MVLYTWSMHCSHVGPHLATFFSFWVPIFVPRSPFSLLGPHGFWPQCTWSFREPPHNTCKMAISRECAAAKLPHDVEVYGLFAHLLPAVATEQGVELQFARACQGLVPDFRLQNWKWLVLGQHGILLEQQEREFKEEQQLWHHLIDVSSPSMIASSTAQLEMRGDHWSPSWSHLASLVVGPWGMGHMTCTAWFVLWQRARLLVI